MKRTAGMVAVLALAGMVPPALAQDQDAAAERARIANQRIQAEVALRERAERTRRDEAARAAAATQPAAASADATPATVSAGSPPAAAIPQVTSAEPRADMPEVVPVISADQPVRTAAPAKGQSSGDANISRALEQIRSLGELKDAGYVTEAEFEQIKRRILEEAL